MREWCSTWASNKEVAGSTTTKNAGKGDGWFLNISVAVGWRAWPQR